MRWVLSLRQKVILSEMGCKIRLGCKIWLWRNTQVSPSVVVGCCHSYCDWILALWHAACQNTSQHNDTLSTTPLPDYWFDALEAWASSFPAIQGVLLGGVGAQAAVVLSTWSLPSLCPQDNLELPPNLPDSRALLTGAPLFSSGLF